MEIFKNKFLVKLIASICLFLTLLNFAGSSKVYAAGDDEVWGGVLLNPIIDLMTSIGDTIMEILHTSIQSQDVSIIKIDGSQDWWEALGGAIAVAFAILAAAVFIVVVVGATGGIAAGAAALAGGAAKAAFVTAATQAAGGALVGGAVAGILTGVAVKEARIPNDIYLPAFSITAEQIFRNELALFDVNFFNPGTYYTEEIVSRPDQSTEVDSNESSSILLPDTNDERYANVRSSASNLEGETMTVERARSEGFATIIDAVNIELEEEQKIADDMNFKIHTITVLEDEVELIHEDMNSKQERQKATKVYMFSIINEELENSEYLFIKHTYIEEFTQTTTKPDYIVTLSNYNKTEKVGYELVGEGGSNPLQLYETVQVEQTSTAAQLQGIVSTWYFILRNFSLLVLMLLLIYSGIRIVIGSTAGEKAKYKERLMDWLVAICLIFVMHYIMVFAVEIVEKITDLVGKTVNGNMAYIELTDIQREDAEEKLAGYNTTGDGDAFDDAYGTGANGALVWPTDLAGLYRIQSQITETGTTLWAGYSLCYVVLVLFTLFFAFTYARRVLYMAFLTMIAPLVAMTYPIDKITDGKAQAFDAWLKEYIFNLMIQPLHLLLYNILVTSAFALATESPIYALVAIGFMMPAEKLMRRFFGFEKAKTPGLLGGAAGAAIAMTGLQNLMKHKSHGGSSNNSNTKSKDQSKVTYKNRNSVNAMDEIAKDEGIGININANGGANVPGAGSNSQSGGSSQPGGGSQLGGASQTGNSMDISDSQDDESRFRYLIDPEDGEFDNKDSGGENDEGIEEYDPPMFIMDDERAEQQAADEMRQREEAEQQAAEEMRQREKEQRKAERQEQRRRIGSAVGTVASDVGRNVAANALRGMHPMRLAGKIAAGATVGTAGLLLGVASGDPNKAFQYTTAGAMAGSALAGSLSGGKITSDGLEDDVEMAYYGSDYKKHKVEEQNREFQRDSANINYIRKTLGASEEEAKQILATTGEQCFSNGITNVEDVAAIHQLTNGDNKLTFKQAVAAREYAEKRLPSDTDKMTARSIQQHKDRWANEFKAKYGNLKDEQAEALANKSFDMAIRFNKAKSGLTKM